MEKNPDPPHSSPVIPDMPWSEIGRFLDFFKNSVFSRIGENQGSPRRVRRAKIRRVDYGPDGLSDSERREVYDSIDRNGDRAMEAWSAYKGNSPKFTFEDDIFKKSLWDRIRGVI